MGTNCSSDVNQQDIKGMPQDRSDFKTSDMDQSMGEDEKKPLGMHISAIRKFLTDHPNVAKESLTTSQTSRDVIKPKTSGTNKPYINLYKGQMDKNGVQLVAPATVFVSHAWRYSFADTVADPMEQHAAKDPNAYFWFDLFTNDQNAIASKDFDWFSNTFKGSIREIGQVLLILSPWNSPIPLRRAWCLFEISTAINEGAVEFSIYLPEKEIASMSASVEKDSNCLIQALSDIQALKAEATSEDDKKQIFSVIQKSEGGFFSVNNHVKASLREWYVSQLTKLAKQSSGNHELQLAVVRVINEFGFYDEALAIAAAIVSEDKREEAPKRLVASQMYLIGTVHFSKRDFDQALKYHEKALSLTVDEYGHDNLSVADSYSNMGMAYTEKGDLDKALECYEKALKIRMSLLGEKHPDIAGNYSNMAIAYYKKGDLAKAEEHYSLSLTMKLDIDGEKDPDVPHIYNNIARIYLEHGNILKAQENHAKSLQINIQQVGEFHPHVANSYNDMAISFREQGELDACLEYHHKALKIRLSVLGDLHPSVALSYTNIGSVYTEKGEYDLAIENYDKAVTVRLALSGEADENVMDLYENIIFALDCMGDTEKLERYYEKMVAATQNLSIPFPAS